MRVLIALLLVTSAAANLLSGKPRRRFSSTFKTLPKHPDFQQAKNVCIKVTDPCSKEGMAKDGDDLSNKYLAMSLHLQPMPKDFQGKVLESGLLITRSQDVKFDKHNTFFQLHSQELSESMLPMFEFIHSLHQKVDQNVFSAVIMPQVPSAQKFTEHKSFDSYVLDSLLETAGSKGKTEKMFCEDMAKQEMTCFNRLIQYQHGHSKSQTMHLTSKAAATALREHASVKEKMSTGRQAVLILRKDHMGWVNFVEVEQKLRKLLSDKCWNLKTVEPDDAHCLPCIKQPAIASLADADLVVANHGPHNEHMIWMPRGAAFIEDKNCKCSSYGYEQLANQEGIHYAMTASSNYDAHECELQNSGEGICTKDKPRVVDFELDILPTVEKTIELLEKSRSTPNACNKQVAAADDEFSASMMA